MIPIRYHCFRSLMGFRSFVYLPKKLQRNRSLFDILCPHDYPIRAGIMGAPVSSAGLGEHGKNRRLRDSPYIQLSRLNFAGAR